MGAVASRHLLPLSEVLKFAYFRENKSVSSYMGWHGVGMSMAAKAVAKAAKESKLFDVVVLVRAGEECSPRKLQTRIAKQLGIIHRDDEYDSEEEEEIDEQVAIKIYESLGGRKFLLIIDNLLHADEGVKLGSMGVPTPQQWNKYFITTPNHEVISAMNSDDITILSAPQFEEAPPPPSPVEADIFNIGGVDELLEHFRDEAGDVADAVSNNNAIGDLHVQVSRDQVFNFFIYLFLLQKLETNEKELMKYYVGEGLITSLLQDGKDMDDLEAAFKVGQTLLGEMASRWMVDRSSPAAADGKISVNSHLWKILEKREGLGYLKQSLHIQLEATHVLEHDAKWIALPNINNIQTFLLQQYKNPQLSTLLLNDNPQLTQIPDNFFLGIPNLRVLDLSRTSISSLPPSLSSLVHLRFLKLRECSSLNSLPPTLLEHLKRLIILDLHATPISNVPTEAFEQMPDLRLLDLSNTNTQSFPSALLSSLQNLEQLFLSGCGSLVVSLPALLGQLPALEELDVSGCGALKGVENVSFEDMPKLRAVNLSNTEIARLSFTRCRSLEIVRLQGLANVKSLHLSSVKIKEFPREISKLKSLEQLRLTDVQHLEKVEWKEVDWLPTRLEWDQCGCSTASALRPEEQAENRASSAYISVSNANIFRGIDSDSPIWRNCFSKFHIYISPCGKQHKKEKAVVVNVKRGRMMKPLVYAGIHSKINPNLSRHLEIEGVDGVLHRSLKIVVGKAEVLWLRKNGFVKSLSADFGLEREEVALKECRVEGCHNMDHLFPEDMERHVSGLKGRLWVSDMGSLRRVYHGRHNFTALKHLRIECCPKLEKLFGRDTYLVKLETLHIRFCARLEQVHEFIGEDAFPQLRSILVRELPKLNYICAGSLLRLEKLRVRACPKLQRLPGIANPLVKIDGESDWYVGFIPLSLHGRIMNTKATVCSKFKQERDKLFIQVREVASKHPSTTLALDSEVVVSSHDF